jgi:hypothetical protein
MGGGGGSGDEAVQKLLLDCIPLSFREVGEGSESEFILIQHQAIFGASS